MTSPHGYRMRLYILVFLLLLAVAGLGYLWHTYDTLTKAHEALTQEKTALDQTFASTSLALAEATSTIYELEDDNDDLRRDLRKEKRRNDDLEDEIRDTIDTVKDLNKLAQIDEELLIKYSDVFFLNENYIPANLRKIDDDWVLAGKKEQYFMADALPFLEDMLEEAEDDDIDLKIVSAYRSFDEQNQLKGQFTQQFGEGANAFSADQGFSEHQLGTTVDLTDPETGGTFATFADTEAYEWLQDNAHKFGFVLSYPEGNEFFIFEPWHWRFVGVDLARDLDRANASFYDWEQREINEYLIKIFD